MHVCDVIGLDEEKNGYVERNQLPIMRYSEGLAMPGVWNLAHVWRH